MPSSDAEHTEILSFLEDPASYPHGPDSVTLVQTHASYVAIVPPLVFKVKKPLNLGFLDFSTLEKRAFYCREEVRLNRRLCADTYRGVTPVSRSDGVLHFGEGEDVVDYAVEMNWLDDAFFLNRLLREGRVTPCDIDRIVEKLAVFYEKQRDRSSLASWGRLEKLKVSTDENFEQTTTCVDRLISRPSFEAVRYFTDQSYLRLADLFARRCDEGHILDCHGDLHLDHVHLSPEGVCIYDCIEFNERFRYIDIANDVAFLAMDLEFNDACELAAHFTTRMAAALSDPGLIRLQPFYRCYRAYVRAKVEAMKSDEPEVSEPDREAAAATARRYFELAARYAVTGNAPFVLIVMGSVGTGKSTQAARLSEVLGWPVVSSDRVRKELGGMPLYRRGSDEERAALYSKSMTDRTYRALFDRGVLHARQSRGVILDATYGLKSRRTDLRARLDERGLDYAFVVMEADDEVVQARLARRETEPGVVSDARLEDWRMLASKYEAPDLSEDRGLVVVDSSQPERVSTELVLRHLVDRHLAAA